MLSARQNVREITVDEYSKNLIEHFRTTYTEVERVQEEMVESGDGNLKGRLSAVHVGDVVLVKRVRDEKQPGPVRFHGKTYPDLCRAKKKINAIPPFHEQQHAERLVKSNSPH